MTHSLPSPSFTQHRRESHPSSKQPHELHPDVPSHCASDTEPQVAAKPFSDDTDGRHARASGHTGQHMMSPAEINGDTSRDKGDSSQSSRHALADLGSGPNGTVSMVDKEGGPEQMQNGDTQLEWDKLASSLKEGRNGEETLKNGAGLHQPNGSATSSVSTEPSPRRGQQDKVLKLSPAKMEELMSSPDSIPVRTISKEFDQDGKIETAAQSLLSLQTTPESPKKTPRNQAKSRSSKTIHLDDPPKFLVSENGPSSAPVRHRAQSSRIVSSPVVRSRRNSVGNEPRLAQNSTTRSKPDRPNHIDLEARNNLAPSQTADPVPSPMPPSIPLPPLSIPTYLQLELSSSRPSPLYIHRSVTSDFPYESSRVKIERLLNFLLLPPALERVLLFGTMACLDAWLYSFTILPLRFVKALYILITSWVINLSAEIRFISGFIVKGVGRVWRRRRTLPGQQRGDTRSVSGNSTATAAADRDARSRSSTARPEGNRRSRQSVFQKHRRQKSIPSALLPNDKADILKGFLMIATCLVLMRFDASRMYHWIRGQAAIKLYVIYNVLEVSDRLLSAIGQDVLECLFSREALERKPDGRSKVLRPFWLFILALAYTVLHATSLFYQVITLNVAVNSYSNALITLLLSNQFVEIKSTVFKKFEKENLFQLTCADVVERFQLWLMLIIIGSRNIVETGVFSSWGSLGGGLRDQAAASTNSTPLSTSPRTSSSILPQSFTLFPSSLLSSLSGANSILPTLAQVLGPFMVVLGSEMLVDWLKHAYINKFNNTRPAIYGRFLDVLAKDYYTNAFADQNLTRRLGLPIIPLACLFFRVSVQTYQMFLTSWLPQHPSPTPNTTSLSSIHQHYSSRPSPSPSPFSLKTAIPSSVNRLSSLFSSVINNALPSPARSIPVFTVTLVLTGYVILLLVKLLMGMLLLSYARARYKAMKEREREQFFGGGQKSSQPHGREHIVEGGRRVGGWGVVEVDDDKRRWIYADDPEGLRKLKQREERDKNPKDSGPALEGVNRYDMVAKRIW
ncbi:hypothetical protein VTN77DRAFT_3693 [Rasamsonia byssochlamydoides]|uniref:uncharacterized protein n=1 Tax=Rasamsonia byssochlamydoides TaxID=89139 RepID=UPI003742C6D7